MKQCTRCPETDPTRFSKRTASPDGLCPWCKACRKQYAAAYYEANRGAVNAACREAYSSNPDPVKAQARAWAEKHPLRVMLMAARRRAKSRNVPFAITESDIEVVWPIDNQCPVLGVVLERSVGKVGPTSPSLDALRPKLGYIPGNIRVISYRANLLKSDVTDPRELESIAKWLRLELEK